MYATWSDYNWNTSYKRQFIAFIVSVLLILLLLFIPIHMQQYGLQESNSIVVEFSKVIEKEVVVPESKTIPKVITKPKEIKTQISKPEAKNIVNQSVKIAPLVEAKSTKPLLSASAIIGSLKSRSSYQALDKDFQAKTAADDDFKFKTIKKSKIYQVTKFINEEVDKPEVEMNFYSDGIVGSTERFFDKISYKKVFTTRYGTKIYCGGIGPLAICSWK